MASLVDDFVGKVYNQLGNEVLGEWDVGSDMVCTFNATDPTKLTQIVNVYAAISRPLTVRANSGKFLSTEEIKKHSIKVKLTNESRQDGYFTVNFAMLGISEKLRPVKDLRAEKNNNTSVKLTWSAPIGNIDEIDGYDVYVDGKVTQTITSGKTATIIDKLNAGKEYKFKVLAFDREGIMTSKSPESEIEFTIPATSSGAPGTSGNQKAANGDKILPIPSNFKLKQDNSKNSVELTWSAISGSIVKAPVTYEVFQVGKESTKVGETKETKITIPNLNFQKTYQFTVRAKDSKGDLSKQATIAKTSIKKDSTTSSSNKPKPKSTTITSSSSGSSGESGSTKVTKTPGVKIDVADYISLRAVAQALDVNNKPKKFTLTIDVNKAFSDVLLNSTGTKVSSATIYLSTSKGDSAIGVINGSEKGVYNVNISPENVKKVRESTSGKIKLNLNPGEVTVGEIPIKDLIAKFTNIPEALTVREANKKAENKPSGSFVMTMKGNGNDMAFNWTLPKYSGSTSNIVRKDCSLHIKGIGIQYKVPGRDWVTVEYINDAGEMIKKSITLDVYYEDESGGLDNDEIRMDDSTGWKSKFVSIVSTAKKGAIKMQLTGYLVFESLASAELFGYKTTTINGPVYEYDATFTVDTDGLFEANRVTGVTVRNQKKIK